MAQAPSSLWQSNVFSTNPMALVQTPVLSSLDVAAIRAFLDAYRHLQEERTRVGLSNMPSITSCIAGSVRNQLARYVFSRDWTSISDTDVTDHLKKLLG
jgi:hypothetical protein